MSHLLHCKMRHFANCTSAADRAPDATNARNLSSPPGAQLRTGRGDPSPLAFMFAERVCPPAIRHHPRKRVIQYSRASVFIISALEYWVARSSRAMTTEYGFSFSRHHFVRGIQFRSLPLQPRGRMRPSREGAGKTGCAPHPRSRVHLMLWKKRTRAYRFSGNTPAFPAQWLYGLYAISLAAELCHHRRRDAQEYSNASSPT